ACRSPWMPAFAGMTAKLSRTEARHGDPVPLDPGGDSALASAARRTPARARDPLLAGGRRHGRDRVCAGLAARAGAARLAAAAKADLWPWRRDRSPDPGPAPAKG